MTATTAMTNQLRNLIDAATYESDLDQLADMLCEFEDASDSIRCILYTAIDRVSANLDRVVTIDELLTI